MGSAGNINIGTEKHRLYLNRGIRRIIGICATQGDASHICGKLMVLSELELRVLGRDSQCVIHRQQFFNTGLSSHSSSSLSQQVLAGESASGLGIIPYTVQLALIDLHTANHQTKQAVNGVLRTQSAKHTTQDAAEDIP